MMKPNAEMIEAVAKAIRVSFCWPDVENKEAGWEGNTRQAQAAVTAYHAELERRGMIMVPVEPTDKMLEQAGYVLHGTPENRVKWTYKAMLEVWKRESEDDQ